jgi:hypothetical protein
MSKYCCSECGGTNVQVQAMIVGVKIVKTALNLSKYESSSDRGF